ncbi:MAG: right-handed parallel beta-helix repeat-containing protein [Verrucomicrobia bacterium]|nr:right-handed parallel beta-helix repeat-containing protein [Verrucomicrobiota bacterium]
MKLPLLVALLALFSTLIPQLSTCLAQGSLTPPGAPAPTMKTLTQIEPRTPVGTATTPGDSLSSYRIAQPGAYYLTTNLTGVSGRIGIGIDSDNVTLDLNGFALIGVTGSSIGIAVMGIGHTNISVRNGAIQGWGDYGMNMGAGHGCTYRDLRLSQNIGGLRAGSASVITACVAIRNTGIGISAGVASVITACSAQQNTNHGFQATSSGVLLSECNSAENGGNGFHGATSVTYQRCVSRDNTGHGFYADTGGVFQDCMASVNGTNGVRARARSYVLRNSCNNNGGAGIAVDGDASRIEANHVTGNTGAGIEVNGTVNLIFQNSARGNGLGNYDIVTGNRVGLIVVPTVSGNISGNGPGSGFGTTDPWANFAF